MPHENNISSTKTLKLVPISLVALASTLATLLWPHVAFAKEVTQTVKTTMTIELQQVAATTPSTPTPIQNAQTGDALAWFIAVLLVFSSVLGCVAFRTRRCADATNAENVPANSPKQFVNLVIVGIVSILLATFSLSFFMSKTFASERVIEANVESNSHIIVDDTGKVVSTEINVINNRSNEVKILDIVAPENFDGWSCGIVNATIEANSELKGTWNCEQVPSDVLTKLKAGENVVLTCDSTLSFDETYEIADENITADLDDKVYCAEQITPDVEIEDLTYGEDYEIEYGENITAGEDAGKIIVKGLGFWEGEKVLTFDILKKEIDVTWSDTSFTYDKQPHAPTAEANDVFDGDTVNVTISGEQTNAGTYEASATINEPNYSFSEPQTTNFTIAKKKISADVQASASDKTYDGTTDAKVKVDAISFDTLIAGDTLDLKSVEGTFSSKTVEENKKVALSNFTFEGESLQNYEIEEITHSECTATISQKEIKVASGVTADNKTYDANNSATINIENAQFDGVCTDDSVTLKGAKGEFDNKNAGTAVKITLSNFLLEGTDAQNYCVATTGNFQPTANITQKEIKVSGFYVKERAYEEGNTSATIEGVANFEDGAFFDGDAVAIGQASGVFEDDNAGDDKNVKITVPLAGTAAGNYAIDESCLTLKGNILAIVKFCSNNAGSVADQTIHLNSKANEPTLDERDGLQLENWYSDAKCSNTWDFETSTASDNVTTLYAGWRMSDDTQLSYWIAPAKLSSSAHDNSKKALHENEDYITAEWNIVKTDSEIRDDVKVLNDTTHETYSEDKFYEVKEQWESYMYDDNFHLYTKIGEGAEDDDYAEFRIVQVGPHDEDGSVLSFVMSHVLPSRLQLHNAMTNSVSWSGTTLYSSLNTSAGAINQLFNDTFKNDIMTLNKKTTAGNKQSNIVTSENKFWILAACELWGSVPTHGGYFQDKTPYQNEGSQYAYYQTRNISSGGNCSIINDVDRSGELVNTGLQTRSPWLYDTRHFLYANSGGAIGYSTATSDWGPNYARGVQLGFALGSKRIIKFDNQGRGNTVEKQEIYEGKTVNEPTNVGSVQGLTLEGWYTNPECSTDAKWDFANDKVEYDTTLYANWVPDETTEAAYWLAPAMTITTGNTADVANQPNPNYVSEKTNVKKSTSEIQADVQQIKNGNAKTIAEYKKYMEDDNYHLYTKYSDANSQGDKDNFAEFRIIEVASHDGGECLTFQATHLLPSANRMSNNQAGTGGWNLAEMRAKLQPGGSTFNSFNEAFTNDISTVTKTSSAESQSSRFVSTNDKFWIASRKEITGGSLNEGSQYSFFSNVGVTDSASNPALSRTTREGGDAIGNYRANYWWMRTPAITWDDGFLAVTSDGTASNFYSYYATQTIGIVPCFSLGMQRTVTYDTQGHGNATMTQNVEIGKTTSPPDAGTATGLTLEGWYDNPACYGTKVDFTTATFEKDTTLYANWVPDESEDGNLSYWIGPSMTTTTSNSAYGGATSAVSNSASDTQKNRSNYVKEEWNVLKSSSEIKADVEKIKEGDATVIAEYEKYMQDDNYHLYTKYGANDVKSANNYAEFRIIEVSGQTGHPLSSGESDGSAITFMATHVLPDASAMNGTSTADSSNDGGWPASIVHSLFQEASGEIFNKFNVNFTDDITTVKKEWANGGTQTQTEEPVVSEDKLWLLSYSEIIDSSDSSFRNLASKMEGTRYAWFANLALSTGNNSALIYATRAGESLGEEADKCYWWLRSADLTTITYFLTVNNDGLLADNNGRSFNANGIAPCFAF